MEGIGNLCEQLGIDASSDVRALVLMWKLGANSKPGCIRKEEFMNGMRNICKTNLEELKSYLPGLDTGFLEQQEFRGLNI